MEARLKRNMMIITAVHVVLVFALVVHGAISDWLKRRDKPETVTIVDLRSMPAPSLDEFVPEPMPEPPAPEPEPPTPEPVVEPPPEPVVPKPTPKKIEVSKKRVRRSDQPEPPRKSAPTPQDISRRLRDGMRSADPLKTSDFAFPGYLSRMRAALYQAWAEPRGDDIPVGTVTRVRITVQRDGRITAHSLVGASGYDRMDATVLAAVRSVGKLPPLPERYARNARDFTIAFELERGAF